MRFAILFVEVIPTLGMVTARARFFNVRVRLSESRGRRDFKSEKTRESNH